MPFPNLLARHAQRSDRVLSRQATDAAPVSTGDKHGSVVASTDLQAKDVALSMTGDKHNSAVSSTDLQATAEVSASSEIMRYAVHGDLIRGAGR